MTSLNTQDLATLRRPRLAIVPKAPAKEASDSMSSIGGDDTLPPPDSAVRRCAFRPAEVGDLLDGRFLLQRMAGSGGMGEVFEAIDTVTGATVAVKVLSVERLGEAPRFEREALVLASLKHPGIVRYVAHGSGTSPYLAMEWLEGEDLSQRLAREPLTLEETLALAVRVGEALAEIHARGVIHRDVKPGNIFLVNGDPRQAKILDLGLARVGMMPALTKAGTLVGTLGYVAPEQAQHAPQLDARADVYSLGCVIFKCLTGKPVFSAPNMIGMIIKVIHEEAPALRDQLPGVPSELDTLVAKMLAKSPDRRPGDVRAVVAELGRIRP